MTARLASGRYGLDSAANHLDNAIYRIANDSYLEVAGDARQRRERSEALADLLCPHLLALVEQAKAKSYTGWSTAARARGHKIRYAPTAH